MKMAASDAAGEAKARVHLLAETTAEALKLQFDLTWTSTGVCDPRTGPHDNVFSGCMKAFNVDEGNSHSFLFPLLFVNIDIRGVPLTNAASRGGSLAMLQSKGPTMEDVIAAASEGVGKEVKLAAEGNSGGVALVAVLAWAETIEMKEIEGAESKTWLLSIDSINAGDKRSEAGEFQRVCGLDGATMAHTSSSLRIQRDGRMLIHSGLLFYEEDEVSITYVGEFSDGIAFRFLLDSEWTAKRRQKAGDPPSITIGSLDPQGYAVHFALERIPFEEPDIPCDADDWSDGIDIADGNLPF